MQQKLNNPVLVLPSWYPNKLDKFAGDFIQRHVKAIALYVPQYIIHFVKDEYREITKDYCSEICNFENYTEEIIYYAPVKTGIPYVDKFLSYRKFSKIYKKTIINYLKTNKKPLLVHAHVTLSAGIIASWIKQKFKIPFILSEHWTIYLPESTYKVDQLNFIYKKHLSKALKDALFVTVVSDYLGKAIQHLYPFVKYKKISNTVDMKLFYPVEKKSESGIKFIHASLMNYQKNIEDILYAAKIVMEMGVPFSMDLFGPIHNSVEDLIDKLNLGKTIFLKGEVAQPLLAKEMQYADALILYSRFETFGCVIIEAHACGLPVITSDLEIFKETILPGLNGMFAKGNNPSNLAAIMLYYCSHHQSFSKTNIAKTAQQYSYEKIGKEFENLYNLSVI